MAASDNIEVVNNLEAIYDNEYRPATQKVFALLPRLQDEKPSNHALRLASLVRSSDPAVVDAYVDAIRDVYTPAKKFIRFFIEAHKNNSCPHYFKQSGYARALNVFVMMFPYDTVHYASITNQDVTITWEDLPYKCSKETVFWELMYSVLYPQSQIDIDVFHTETMVAVLKGVVPVVDFLHDIANQ